MSIFNRTVTDDLTLDEDFPALRFSRQTLSIVEQIEFRDDDIVPGGSKRVLVDEDFYIEDVVVGWNSARFISVEEDFYLDDFVVISGFGKGVLVADSLIFTETIRNNRRAISVTDNFVFAESRSLRFSNPRVTVIDNFVIAEQVLKVLVLDKMNLKVSDIVHFNEANTQQNFPHPITDTLVFVETVERWLPRQRPTLIEVLTFHEVVNPQRSRPNSDQFQFSESICICLTLGRTIIDGLFFAEQINVYINNRVIPPDDGGLGDNGGVDFPLELAIDVFDELQFYEGFVILKNNVNILTRPCCA